MSSFALFAALVIPLSLLQFTSITAFAATAAAPAVVVSDSYHMDVVASAQPSQRQDHASYEVRGNFSSTSASDTGACSDYTFQFNRQPVATSEETLQYSGPHLRVLAGKNGGIRLRRSQDGQFAIRACKAAGGSSAYEAERNLSSVVVEERGGSVTVNGPDSGDWMVHLIVDVPDGREVTAMGNNGPVDVRGVDATILAEVTNGPLAFDDSRGSITARVQNGPLSLHGVTGNIDASAINGPLTVMLSDDQWIGGELRASVKNGPLSVVIPRDYHSGVQVRTNGKGPFSCSLPECGAIMAEFAHPSNWKPIDMTFGNGPTRVFLEGGNGPVAISRP